MKFQISRASSYCEKPCENASLETVSGYDKWTIEINSLDELIEFSKLHGGIIINEETIEIYDGYRE